MIRKTCQCGAKYSVASDCMPGHLGVSVPCRRCGRNVYFELEEHPVPEQESWWARLRARLGGEVCLFDSNYARPLNEPELRVPADPKLLTLFTPPRLAPPPDLTALRDQAAIIDWRSDADEVMTALAEAAATWEVAPLWSEVEAVSWRNSDELKTWELVDELVSRFKAKGLGAFDTESNGDGYGLLFVPAEDEEQATKLARAADPDGDLRPFRARKFA